MKKTVSCDFAVVGAGGAGLSAAVRAAELGLKVALIEKTDHFGGSSNHAGMMTAIGTKRQKEEGKDKTTIADAFKEIMTATRWVANPVLARKYLENSATYMEWVLGKGLQAFILPGNDRLWLSPFGVGEDGGVGWQITQELAKEAQESDNVQVFTEARAEKLVMDGHKVSGVLVKTKDGELEVQAPNVFISCGGYSNDDRKLMEDYPKIFSYGHDLEYEAKDTFAPFADGDGIRMCEEIGSKKDYHLDVKVCAMSHHTHWSITNMTNSPVGGNACIVNKNGKRFITEGTGSDAVMAQLKQPEGLCYFLFDEDTKNYLASCLTNGPADDDMKKEKEKNQEPESFNTKHSNVAQEHTAAIGIDMAAQFKQDLIDENASGKHTKIADTVEGLAEFIGCDPKTLADQVARYNRYCADGYDAEFFKDAALLRPIAKAPFYAVEANIFRQATHGGISINDNLNVVDKNDVPFEGLYAGGVNASGLWSEYGFTLGMSFSWVCNSGYLTAEHVAKEMGK